MEIVTRTLKDSDKVAALHIEAGAMPNNRYLDDVWDMFISRENGVMLGAFINEQLQGIGRITRLYNNIGWLETLRVHPDYQNKGIGRVIYKRYFEAAETLGLNKLGMYTENYNIVSKTLAQSEGLDITGNYLEMVLPVDKDNISCNGFSLIPTEKAEEVLSKHYDDMGDYIVVNKTFYPVGKGLGELLAKNRWAYTDQQENIVIAGNRYHSERMLHVPYIYGDKNVALKFVNCLAVRNSAPTLSTMQPIGSENITKYHEIGFKDADEFMTLWKDI